MVYTVFSAFKFKHSSASVIGAGGVLHGNEIASVYVESKKVHAMPSSEYEHAVYFDRFGMVDLSTPAEIFDFASAMMELAKQEGIIRENARINYAPNVKFRQEKVGQYYYEEKMEVVGISVNIIWDSKKKSTPSLKAW